MTPSSVLVSWTPPTVGTPPLYYITNHRVNGNQAWIPNPLGLTTSTNQAITGLVGGTTYNLQLQVSNSAGVALSNIVNFTTPVGAIVLRDCVAPIEWSGQVVVARDADIPVEFRLSVAALTQATRDARMNVEWTGSTGTTRDTVVQIELGPELDLNDGVTCRPGRPRPLDVHPRIARRLRQRRYREAELYGDVGVPGNHHLTRPFDRRHEIQKNDGANRRREVHYIRERDTGRVRDLELKIIGRPADEPRDRLVRRGRESQRIRYPRLVPVDPVVSDIVERRRPDGRGSPAHQDRAGGHLRDRDAARGGRWDDRRAGVGGSRRGRRPVRHHDRRGGQFLREEIAENE